MNGDQSAFPQTAFTRPEGDIGWPCQFGEGGMSIRDYFAVQMLAAWRAKYGNDFKGGRMDAVRTAIEDADALLAELAKGTPCIAR